MAIFVRFDNNNSFEDIKKYVKEKLMTKFYLTPNLLLKLLNDFTVKCVVGLNPDDVKVKSQSKCDLICTAVYSKVYQNDAFRVDAITINKTCCKLGMAIDDEDVIFGLKGENEEYWCFESEEL